MSTAVGGTCKTCERSLVQVSSDDGEVEQVYHPFDSFDDGGALCPALLPIAPDDPTSPMSWNVPADQFQEVTEQ